MGGAKGGHGTRMPPRHSYNQVSQKWDIRRQAETQTRMNDLKSRLP